MVAVLFSIHIAGSRSSFHVCEKLFEFSLSMADGFKTHRLCYAICFFSPTGIIPAIGVDRFDFVSHG